ncbi:indolepyruvate ferredoxin oxidoreductase family protein [Comamonas aquatica]|uniref:Indolepyruvate ferredoxin oxidoreductase family protein n=1 Tax=Comamonas aquatica TaxID=225991 RepID=A0AA42W437_9BURK|nr:indolepyruvate ferredoxin oxidoreductase family protein [Comamonas aquatica]MDH1430309.1 indolepyruvate ferredoxin oxidoreductase family protein [Comamonas aquatica]MDH1604161.1 indolepyruvate ferredoxin oxidoreductase family protein [Comamonas aquatica]MDH1616053.1 indolepyruvate ferredoxin oxidoreductase family protein [Comamonas aquatica]MDH2006330.1 indolepyruvate ferredoxin oxidoreductase family protein [Comamonas aquatica]
MNAPLDDVTRRALESITLDDKYTLERGRAFMSGVQALVRLPMLQRQRDAKHGLNTAGFISGYRGSPLGTYDQSLWAAKKHLEAQHIVFQPGVNEELAATAVWGTQQLDLYPQTKKYDGVFGIWYGKGPGVDRCSDVFKHANMAGTAQHGGVIAIAGDDHISKSSTAAHQSDHIFKACGTPVFFPSNVQDILDMGLHAFAMSRFSGLWSGMKTIQEVVESSASIAVDPDRVNIVLPEDFQMPPGGLHIRWPDAPLEQEARLMDYKWYAALAYVRANKLNYNVVQGVNDRFGLIASGKAYNDMRQALVDLGLDDAVCRQLGIRVHKVNVVWPLEASITRDFAQGLQEILVVEEKRQVIEYQLKEELYNWRPDVRPNVLGKFDEQPGDDSGGEWSMPNPSQNWLLRPKADLTPAIIAQAIAKRLKKLGVPADIEARMEQRLAVIAARERALAELPAGGNDRTPWFCSGCPHNTSTRVPEGSRAVAGIGCHYMTTWMPDRNTSTFTQMGGEGVTWVGQSPFTQEAHVFANLGDGTYFHSGLLAIRQSIAAGVNITYKILYNDAVAMTGGQTVGERPEGHSVAQIAHSLRAEGVVKLVVVTDDPSKYHGRTHHIDANPARAQHQELINDLPAGIEVFHRDELDRIQREFRAIPGCTAIIYDQTCATEKRRRRKRGTLATPDKTVVINELVCEGCGDCSVQSNCLSVEPVETPFGRKRRINQNTCNKDYSCVNGFCPSFVTVEGGTLKKPKKEKKGDLSSLPAIPEPQLPRADTAWGIVVGGVGGTGVITIGSLLGMAAHLEGKGVITQDAGGLAQKGGATWSHIQIANRPEAIYTTKVDMAKADLVIGCDPIVAANKASLAVMQNGRTFVALNSHGTPTAAFVHNPDWQFPGGSCEAAIAGAVGPGLVGCFDAEQAAVQLLGDSIYTNPLMLGYAWQKGRVPLTRAALMRAMELNGVQVANNQAAFEWGRRCAHNLAEVEALYCTAQVIQFVKKTGLQELVAQREQFLTEYQNAAYAAQYRSFVDQVQAAEGRLGSSTRLTEAVARYLFKLMAYKDEYEVARLHTDPAFTAKIADMFDGDYKLVHHLAPPLSAAKNAQGHLVKKSYQPWIRSAFGVLAKLKGLRGTPLDLFGRAAERQTERALIVEYRDCITQLLPQLTADKLELAVQIARIPEDIRGYGHVKERHLAAARSKWQGLMQQWQAPQPGAQHRA